MISLPSGITPVDVQQWLEGGYFYVEGDSGKLVLCHLRSAEEDYARVTTVDGERLNVPFRRVRPHWPLCGAVNLARCRYAVNVTRLQRRQYRRTYNARCVEVSIPGKWQCLKKVEPHMMNVTANDKDLVAELFSPSYPCGYEEAAQRLNGEWASVALNRSIILVGAPTHVVYYLGENVGTMRGGVFLPDTDPATEEAVINSLGGQE